MSMVRYSVVDVFTDRPFTGNPLAIVHDAQDLATEQMHAIAREFNLSETIFVLPPTTPEATYRVRIFTPGTELPFAGHPSVGCAVTLHRAGVVKDTDVVQECGAGLIPIRIDPEHHSATVTGGEPTVGAALDPAPLLAAVGLTEDDYVGPAPRTAGCGLEFAYLSVTDEAVTKLRLRQRVDNLSVFHWDAERHEAHARVLVPEVGVAEDPATGSAALGLGVWLVAAGLLPGDGLSQYKITQGVEIHRPSSLQCSVTASGGAAVTATVGGHVVPIASGEMAVPPFVG
ncbi:PhzF family phenazine biosynthesis protein [Dactylosporangium sp. AC04546]|uniref:PhzF family phenazine biosynthesis protein n=1 Tax=Dactylosporangium sp. AC04546 TaxID=2862460 RepID=UPI001EE105B2|nr:PhzF family phenazine biosynthesis protein [Dactylosporangium sp. AC04546]WVK84614.1 PhzF family phenazine biosynthesis protein [Dactylosporangium sp. AC04546]